MWLKIFNKIWKIKKIIDKAQTEEDNNKNYEVLFSVWKYYVNRKESWTRKVEMQREQQLTWSIQITETRKTAFTFCFR